MKQKSYLVATIRLMAAGIRLRTATATLMLAVAPVPALLATRSAQAQTFSLLYAFKGGTDGGGPREA